MIPIDSASATVQMGAAITGTSALRQTSQHGIDLGDGGLCDARDNAEGRCRCGDDVIARGQAKDSIDTTVVSHGSASELQSLPSRLHKTGVEPYAR